MKMKKSIIHLLLCSFLLSAAPTVMAEEMPQENPNAGLIESEGEQGEDLFDSIIDANRKEEEEQEEEREEVIIEKSDLSANEELSVSLMKALGVFEAGTDLDSVLTRAELAHAIYILKAYTMKSDSAINTFADINAGTPYSNEISVLYDMGYINGDMGQYRPDDGVTVGEMAAVIMRAIGVEPVANHNGGWIAGYMTTASGYDIFDGVSLTSGEKVTKLNGAVMLKNLLHVSFKENEYTLTGIQGYYMSAVLGISMIEGMVTDNGITAIDGSETIKGRVKIGGESIDANGVDCEGYIGRKVKAYYREVEGGDKYLLAVSPKANQELIHISSEDIEDFSNRTYTYYTTRPKTKEARLASDYSIIYNGRMVTDGTLFDEAMLEPDEGFVELVNSDDDNEYDLVIIEDYVTFVVDEYNKDTNVLRSQENKVKAIDFEEADISIKMMLVSDGKTINVDYQNIAHNGYVLSVARSLDDRIVKIYMAEESVTGYVTSIDAASKEITVDGKTYTASKYISDYVSYGGDYRLNINHYGHIIYGKRAESANKKLAYLEKVYADESGEGVVARLYTEDNIPIIATVKMSATIDSKKYKSTEEMLTVMNKAVDSVVVFKINSDDEIVMMDTSSYVNGEAADGSLNLFYSQADACFDSNTLSFGSQYVSKYPTSFNTRVFHVKTPYQTGQIYCYTLADFKNKVVSNNETILGDLMLYNMDQESVVGTTALVKSKFIGMSVEAGLNINNLNSGAIVTKIKHGIHEGEAAYILTVECDGKKAEVVIEEEAINFRKTDGRYALGAEYTIGCGDIIRWMTNEDGIVEAGNLIVIYDCDEGAIITNTDAYRWTKYWRYSNSWHSLWIYDKEDEFILSVNQNASPLEQFDPSVKDFNDTYYTYVDYTLPLNGQPVSIWIYDMRANELRKSDIGEFITYKDAGIDCTKAVARYNSGHRLFIIYK